MLFPQENAFREVKLLDGFWRFRPDKKSEGFVNGWENGLGESAEIRTIAVPASWNEQFNDLLNFHGKGWYEKEVYVPDHSSGKCAFIRLSSVAGKAKVWVNGFLAAQHTGTALPFEGEVSRFLRYGEKNRIVVLADSSLDPWSLPPAILAENEGRVGFFNSYPGVTYDFFPYGGIQRSVMLYTVSREHIEDVTIHTEISGGQAEVNFCAVMSEEFKGVLRVRTDEQTVVLQVNGKNACGKVTLQQPRLWDIGKPELYTLSLELLKEDVAIDAYEQTYGVRSVKVEGDRFLLNGKPVFFKGFGKHEDFYVIGKGFSHAVTVKDFYLMRWIGANSFRTSHYPYDENILDFADRNGILVIDETPFVGLNSRIYKDDILQQAKSVIHELIERDKNHPCVVMWSLANEPNVDTQEGKSFFEEMARTARKLDSTRPVTYVAHLEPENNLAYHSYDVVCINKYYGWYIAPGQVKETLMDFADCIQRFRDAFGKPMIISEFGADAIEGIHCDPPQMFSEEYQCETVRLQYEEMRKKDYVIGAHVWAFADFKTAQSISRIVLNRKGVFTRDRQPKMTAHMLKKLWCEENCQQLMQDSFRGNGVKKDE